MRYARSYVNDPSLPVVATSLRDAGKPGAVRSHFERLRVFLCEPSRMPERIMSAGVQVAADENGGALEVSSRPTLPDDGPSGGKRVRTDAEVSDEAPKVSAVDNDLLAFLGWGGCETNASSPAKRKERPGCS